MSLTISYECELGKQENCDRTFDNILGHGGDELVCHICDHGKRVVHDDGERPNDPVNSPKHYTAGKIEVIDCIESMIAAIRDPEQAFLAGQVLKYIARYPLKNGVEDLKKSRWYLDRLIGKVGEKK